eukprot:scaffold2941_cov146-Skeletonema_marinoi.AAC.4
MSRSAVFIFAKTGIQFTGSQIVEPELMLVSSDDATPFNDPNRTESSSLASGGHHTQALIKHTLLRHDPPILTDKS